MQAARGRHTIVGLTAAVAAVGLAVCASAQGALPQQSGEVNLLTQANVAIAGAATDDRAGISVASAGDVNGDGRADVIIGASGADNNGRAESGSAYVVYGGGPANVGLAALGSAGFRIDGGASGDAAGVSVAGAGDLNGDGRADVVVGAPGADNNGRGDSGSAYVVFGSAAPADLDLAALGSRGFRIDGAAADDRAGTSVSVTGDLNGDGRADLVIGAPRADGNGRSLSGTAYVVFGGAAPADLDLAALGARGFRIGGAAADDRAGDSVAGAGDVNGDGLADVIVGAAEADNNGRASSGSAYVVYGGGSANIDLAALGSAGFRIDGGAAGDLAGFSVAGAGDPNGDGRADVIIGAPVAGNNGRAASGSAYVVYGSGASANLDLASLGAAGFRIDGGVPNQRAGASVSGTDGDLNGDRYDDVIVSTPLPPPTSAHVIYGGAAHGDVDLAALGAGGYRIDGAVLIGELSLPVSAAGDVNGDGRADALVGSPGALDDSGSAYVVYGFGTSSLSYPPAQLAVGRPATLTPSVRRTGTPSFSVSPPLPGGLGLDPASGVIAGTPTSVGTSSHTVTMSDLTGNVQASFAITVAPAGTVAGGLPAGALCATPDPVATSSKGTIALTTQQLAINQRIGQAAIRRLNAIEAWLNSGILTGDICGGGLGPAEFAPSITTAAGPAQALTVAAPRALKIAPATVKKATFSLSAAQLLINQRIYQAALRRSRGLAARLGGMLSGGDLKDAQVSGAKLALGLAITAASPAPAPAASVTVVAPRSGGSPGKVTLSAAQLAINQKIAQAGVRGANDLRARIQTGLSGANFSDATLTAADLAPGVAP